MKTYICKEPVKMTREEFDRINGLFSIDFEDSSPEMEALINKLDARPDTNPATLSWDFDDGSFIIADIYISDCSAYDDIRWYENKTAHPETFDCGFCIDKEMTFNYVGEARNTYVCLIEITDEKDIPTPDNKRKKVWEYDINYRLKTTSLFTVAARTLSEATKIAEHALDHMSKQELVERFLAALEFEPDFELVSIDPIQEITDEEELAGLSFDVSDGEEEKE